MQEGAHRNISNFLQKLFPAFTPAWVIGMSNVPIELFFSQAFFLPSFF